MQIQSSRVTEDMARTAEERAAREATRRKTRESAQHVRFEEEVAKEQPDQSKLDAFTATRNAWFACDSVQAFQKMIDTHGHEMCLNFFFELNNEYADSVEQERLSRDQADTLKEQLAQQELKTQEVENQNILLRRQHSQAPTEITAGGAKLSPKITDPEQFDDGNHAEYDLWEQSMEHKLEVNADRYLSDKSQVVYIASRLKGTAAQRLGPHLNKNAILPITTAAEFFERLRDTFGDPFASENARRDLRALKQYGKWRKLGDFLGEFQRLAAIGQVSMQEQMDTFRDNISLEHRKGLRGREMNSFKQMIDLVRLIDKDIQHEEQIKSRREFFHKKSGDDHAVSPALKVSTTPAQPSVAVQPSRPPRDLSQMECWNCGQMGHSARTCRNPKKGNEDPASKS